LLKNEVYFKFLSQPQSLREELAFLEAAGKKPALVVIDEIQKVPALLDEVHWLIENKGYSFILCGSSARKLKQTGVNLLGGRAWKFHLFPLTYHELAKQKTFDLLKVFNKGTLPKLYYSAHYKRDLKAYLEDYIQHEIKAEALVRNLKAFHQFLNMLAFTHGELITYSNIARDCGVDSKTVQEYFSYTFFFLGQLL